MKLKRRDVNEALVQAMLHAAEHAESDDQAHAAMLRIAHLADDDAALVKMLGEPEEEEEEESDDFAEDEAGGHWITIGGHKGPDMSQRQR